MLQKIGLKLSGPFFYNTRPEHEGRCLVQVSVTMCSIYNHSTAHATLFVNLCGYVKVYVNKHGSCLKQDYLCWMPLVLKCFIVVLLLLLVKTMYNCISVCYLECVHREVTWCKELLQSIRLLLYYLWCLSAII